MKKLLSAIAGAGILAMATLASAPAQAQIGGSTTSAAADVEMVYNSDNPLDVDYLGDTTTINKVQQLQSDLDQDVNNLLLKSDAELNQEYNDYVGSGEGFDPDGWVISKGGCSVNVGCAVTKVGLPTALSCYATAGLEPEAIASCLQDKGQDKYLAAASCTYGDCPAFAALPAQLVATSTCQYGKNPTLAGNVLLNDPARLEQTTQHTAQPLGVDLLFQG